MRVFAAVVIVFCAMPLFADERRVSIVRHRVTEVEEGSPVWNSLPDAERRRYLAETEGAGFPGKPIAVVDYFVMEPRPGNRIAFCLSHTGHLAHQCTLSGLAEAESDGYRFTDGEAHGCVLMIKLGGGTIRFEDLESRCKKTPYCGARAYFENAEFDADDWVNDKASIGEALAACPLP